MAQVNEPLAQDELEFQMTSTDVKCPGCASRIRIPEGAAGRALRCSRCQQVFRVPAAGGGNTVAAAERSDFSGPISRDATASSQVEQAVLRRPEMRSKEFVAMKPALGSGGLFQRYLEEAERKRALNPSMRPFLRQLSVGLIVLSVLMAITFAIGLLFEPVAMAAVGIALAAMLGMLIAARVWLCIVTFREGSAIGWLCTLIPVFEVLYVNARRGPTLKPAVLFAAAWLPLLLGLGMLLIYRPLYSGSGRTASHAARSAAQVNNLEKLIHETERRVAANPADNDGRLEAQVVTLRVLNPHQADHSTAEKADTALRQFNHYIPGSFSLSEDHQLATFSHRGDLVLAHQYQLLVRIITRLSLVPE